MLYQVELHTENMTGALVHIKLVIIRDALRMVRVIEPPSPAMLEILYQIKKKKARDRSEEI